MQGKLISVVQNGMWNVSPGLQGMLILFPDSVGLDRAVTFCLQTVWHHDLCDVATESKQAYGLCGFHRATFKLAKHHLTQIRMCQSSHTKHAWCAKVWSGPKAYLEHTSEVIYDVDMVFALVLPCLFMFPDAEHPVTVCTAALQHCGAMQVGQAAVQQAAWPSKMCPAALRSFSGARTTALMC